MEEKEVVETKEVSENIPEEGKKMRTYKTVTCKKCGYVHSANDKECPSCGFSMTRQVIKICLIAFVVVALIVSNIFLAIRVSKLEEKVETLEEKVSEGSSAYSGVDISNLEYFQEQLLYDGVNLETLEANKNGEYLIYAMQYDCSACAAANEFVYNFLAAGYPDYIPVYFITPDDAPNAFYEEPLSCESTPTLYRMKGSKVVEAAVGVDEVYNLFDAVVQEATNSTNE